MSNRVGHKIGNYRLVQLLGEGGFAEVYLAEHIYLGSHAAIQLLYVRVAPEEIAQFQQEGRMLAALLHRYIVRVLDFGIEERTPYLVMDYAPGGTLRTRHPKGSLLPLPTIVEYVKQVAQALQHAHDHKFIHRDIKPENMLISREGTLLLSAWDRDHCFEDNFLYLMFITFNLIPEINRSKLGYTATSIVIM